MKLFNKDFDKIMAAKKRRREKKTGKYGFNYTPEFKDKANLIPKRKESEVK